MDIDDEAAGLHQPDDGDRACPPGGGIPFAWDAEDRPIHVSQVKKGQTYRCPACKCPLTAVLKTKVRRQHFRHRRGADCSNAYETSLHTAAEQVIKDNEEILVPAVVAQHGRQFRSITDEPKRFRYSDACLEVQMDGIRPDVVLHEARESGRQLLVEIFVTHRTEQRKIDLIRDRRLPTFEINLSKTPRDVGVENFKESVLYGAKRKWLFNKAIFEAEEELRGEAETRFRGIGASLAAAYEAEFTPMHNRWQQDIEDARIEDLIGAEIPGHRCFAVAPEIWQCAILSRFLRSPDHSRFSADDMLHWLNSEGLLKPAFRKLLGTPDRDLLAHVRAMVKGFRNPLKVVEDYAGQMVLRGLFPTSKSAGASSAEQTEFAEECARRIQNTYYWRLRMAEVEKIFKAIQAEAENGARMDWNAWLGSWQPALNGTPAEMIAGTGLQFKGLVEHLTSLERMLEPGSPIPSAGMLGLPLEPERDARDSERLKQEAAERARVAAEIERKRQEDLGEQERRVERERASEERRRLTALQAAADVRKSPTRAARPRNFRSRIMSGFTTLVQLFTRWG